MNRPEKAMQYIRSTALNHDRFSRHKKTAYWGKYRGLRPLGVRQAPLDITGQKDEEYAYV
ncbi:hypothetical protein GCM10023116_19360 [Kistimonas scapharcae]|uniref:Uncharacterized protein n=1 Tax=Kistimonas scapharcae TaxID=1036133 RepID=A0ABP8V2K5_9GAMM